MKRSAFFFVFINAAVWCATLLVIETLVQAFAIYTSLILFSLVWRHQAGEQEQLDWYLLSICLLGPLGVPAALACYFIWPFSKLDDTQREAWYDELRGHAPEMEARTLANEAAIGRVKPQSSTNTRSAIEIFRRGSFQDRQSILLWIARRRDPSLKPLLQHAMRCEDSVIRSQAASLVVRYQTSQTQETNQPAMT